jgi:multidrug resistance efflux pump
MQYVGLAEARQYEVSVDQRGRLEQVFVDRLDPVEAGEPLARLDDARLESDIRTSQARLRMLVAELAAHRADLATQSSAGLRRFQLDIDQLRLDELSLEVVIESDRVELERLRLDLARSESLLAEGLVDVGSTESLALKVREIETRLENNRVLLEQTRARRLEASRRQTEYAATVRGDSTEALLLEPFKAAIEVESRELDAIRLRRSSLVLRSPVSGQVTRVIAHRGETVLPGEPVVVVTERAARELVAYVDEEDAERVYENGLVLVAAANDPSRVAESVILRVGSTVEELPPRLWRIPSAAEHGRPLVIRAVPELDLTPGSRITVTLLDD